ncbi:MAG TPA: hypothetical protein VFE35_10030 [Candidatus Cybelea sp.]|jgi:23S rRNA G2445 N2-methylase RlmL|nr:hypothetical protein [Candidatus Cybelea sp.]
MFDAIKTVAEQAMSGQLDSSAVGQAVSDHLDTVSNDQLSDHLQTAASNLQASGQNDLAQQVTGLVQQISSNPSGAKDTVVSFIQSNPQVLQHFTPDFAQGIASRLGL